MYEEQNTAVAGTRYKSECWKCPASQATSVEREKLYSCWVTGCGPNIKFGQFLHKLERKFLLNYWIIEFGAESNGQWHAGKVFLEFMLEFIGAL